jgi:hypothetical protein
VAYVVGEDRVPVLRKMMHETALGLRREASVISDAVAASEETV